jgi:protein-S-isoprenylcysteine O-methyltransferase Ste14
MRIQPWNVIFLAGFIVYCWIRGAFERRTRANKKVLRRVDTVDKLLVLFVVVTSVFLPVLYLFTPLLRFADYVLPGWAPWCGLVLMVASLWLFWRSHADLGRNWSITLEMRDGHELIKHGVYRSVRHPMYAAIFLFCIAQGLLLANWLAGWAALVSFALLYLVRTPREERMMCEFFGDQYRQYMRETGRLWPRLGRGA